MSYAHNYGGQGQYPYGGQQPPQDPRYANNNRMSYAAGDDTNTYGGINGAQQQEGFQYGALPQRAASSAQRQQNEMFLDSQGPPPPPPRRQDTLNQLNAYPQQMAAPMIPYAAGPSSPGVLRSPTFNAGQQRPYVPAEFVGGDSGLQRHGSTAGYQYGFSPGYPTQQMPAAMPIAPAMGIYQPHHSYATTQPAYAQPQRPSVSAGYSSGPSPPIQNMQRTGSTHSHVYTPPQPPPLPSIQDMSAEDQSPDWGHIPPQPYDHNYQPVRSRYAENESGMLRAGDQSISPPPNYGGRQSRGSSTSHSQPPTPGPPPPPHASHDYVNSRPLPRVPSNASSPGPYYPPQPSAGSFQDLESEISVMLNNSQSPRIEVNSQALPNESIHEYSDTDTDPEATAGLEAMREAERQEAEDTRRRSSGQRASFGFTPAAVPVDDLYAHPTAQDDAPPYPSGEYEEGDMPFADLSSMDGGFNPPMSYGGEASTLLIGRHNSTQSSQPISSSGSLRRSGSHSTQSQITPYPYDDYGGGTIHPFPAFTAARVDAVGTGGLADPTQAMGERGRRDSYDEGDDVGMQEREKYPGIGVSASSLTRTFLTFQPPWLMKEDGWNVRCNSCCCSCVGVGRLCSSVRPSRHNVHEQMQLACIYKMEMLITMGRMYQKCSITLA